MTNANETAKSLDFSGIVDALSRTQDALRLQMDAFGEEIDADFTGLAATMETVRGKIAEIDRYQAVLDEMLTASATSAAQIEDRIGWGTDHSRALREALDEALDTGPQQLSGALETVARRAAIPLGAGFDRLDDIRRRGRLRVAVEPQFVGLSFRKTPGGPLMGLDADYARAFAAFLGVACEFVEHPWSELTQLLHTGRKPGEAPADLVWSALPPDPGYHEIAYSETYTWLPFAMYRRPGDTWLTSPRDLAGKTVGIINDPGAVVVLEKLGLRWSENSARPGGRVRLGNLIAFNDQGRIHDALADGLVDAFMVDRPIFHWAATHPESRWRGRFEVVPGNLSERPYYYTVAVAATRPRPASCPRSTASCASSWRPRNAAASR
ncbi:Bacterial extracellular solute-binding protein, family 3 [Methylobrevis pamukkalensis]|uniref:Bacterial extracellular solute-binding protein, family 3 n=2 Tax=Methylobrevis pamukkalensis TaxID=1439726 RepID=A0A1E3H7D0_9HYPH|nr:Bacterial extracellular solute-binding protein, family 3 [Methylobrevis pamukkalensis]